MIDTNILKGTREFGPQDMAKRDLVMGKIKSVFARFGYDSIETPILNKAEAILGKYGDEGERLTYSFEDNAGRRLALPYDQTVPFARFFAANGGALTLPFKRYQIGRVWRAEKPQKGRLREFYQCDIDIIGTKNLMAEAELVRVIASVFEALNFDKIQIKVNSRALMNDILSDFDLEEDLRLGAIRVIDKLAKIGDDAVVSELEKLGIVNADELLKIIKPEDSFVKTLGKLSKYDTGEIEELLVYCKALGLDEDLICFDPSLARGLDYYTGVIYEVVSLDNLELGSICGGGRYADLCGMFSKKGFSGVGVAFGFERIMIAMEERGDFEDVSLNSQVLVTVFDESFVESSLEIFDLLTKGGINCELYFGAEKLKKQFRFADRKGIPFVIVQGEEEKVAGEVNVKSMISGKQKSVSLSQVISYLKGYEKN